MQDRTTRLSSFHWLSRFASGLAVAVFVLAAAGCDPDTSTRNNSNTEVDSFHRLAGRLTARYATPTSSVTPGLQVLRMTAEGRPFGLYVPSNYDPSRKWPIAVFLHGLGGIGELMALEFSTLAEANGLIIVAPTSYLGKWDLIFDNSSIQTGSTQIGPDRLFIDDLLKWSFDHVAVDPARIGIAGFAHGGIYSLWLGLNNGDLFTRVVAFTPCTNAPRAGTGAPLIFVSHSINDRIWPIACSRLTVRELEGYGYNVNYVEYYTTTGNGHVITPEIMAQGVQFLARQ